MNKNHVTFNNITLCGVVFFLAALSGAFTFVNTANSLITYTLIAGMIAIGGIIISHKRAVIPSAPAMIWAGTFSLATLSILWSMAPHYSQLTWLVFSCGIIALLAGAQSPFLKMAPFILGAPIIAAFLLLLDRLPYIDFQLPVINKQEYDPNGLSALLVSACFLMIAVWTQHKNNLLRNFILGLIAIAVCGIIISNSRGALLCLTGGCALLAFLNRQHVLLNRHKYSLGVIFLCVLCTALFLTWERFDEWLTYPLQDVSISGRLAQWEATVRMITQHPLRGTGLGTYYLAYPAYRPIGLDPSTGYFAHSDPLQWAVELGIGGAIVFYAGIIFILYRAFRLATDHSEFLAVSSIAVGLLTMFINAHWTFLYYLPANIILWGYGLGMLSYFNQQHAVPLYRQARFGLGCFLAVMALLLANIAYTSYYLDKNDTVKATGIGTSLNPNLFLAQADDILLNHEQNHQPISDADRIFVTELLDQATTLNPFSAMPDTLRARMALLNEHEDIAVYFLSTALLKNPSYHSARLLLIQLHERRGEWQSVHDLTAYILRNPLPPYYSGLFEQYKNKSATHLMKQILDKP